MEKRKRNEKELKKKIPEVLGQGPLSSPPAAWSNEAKKRK